MTAVKLPLKEPGILILSPLTPEEIVSKDKGIIPAYFWPRGSFEGRNPNPRIVVASRVYSGKINNLYNGFEIAPPDEIVAVRFFSYRPYFSMRLISIDNQSELDEILKDSEALRK
jgi:hypothetical protein